MALDVPSVAARLVNTISGGLSGNPLQIGYSHSSRTARLMTSTAGAFDLVVAVHARAAAHVPGALRRRSFAFIIDAYGQNYATYAPALPPVERQVYQFEAKRMRTFELRLTREFGGVGVVSEYDRAFLIEHGANPDVVYALPGGADVEHFARTERSPYPDRPVFVFIGRLNYLPNRDAVRRLVSEIWPAVRAAVPGATLRIVGADPSRQLRLLIERNGIELAANVPDVRTEMRTATALLVPMRLGGGIQSKILEAMSAKVPVVSTGFANLGISAVRDEHLLIAESPAEYAAHAARLVSHPDAANALAQRAYEWVSATQSQEAFTGHLSDALDRMLARAAKGT